MSAIVCASRWSIHVIVGVRNTIQIRSQGRVATLFVFSDDVSIRELRLESLVPVGGETSVTFMARFVLFGEIRHWLIDTRNFPQSSELIFNHFRFVDLLRCFFHLAWLLVDDIHNVVVSLDI